MPTLISAHRGGAELHRPETYEAYDSAAASGVDYVEFDVRRLGDGTLVCFHDATVLSRPHGPLPLSALSYDELCRCAGYEVPPVPRLLPLLAGRTMAHVDLKETGYECEVIDLAAGALGSSFIVTSRYDASLRAIHDAFPSVATALSLGRGVGDVPLPQLPAAIVEDLFPVRRIRSCGAAGAAMDKRLVRWGVLRRCSAAGATTMVWTVDRTREMDRLIADPRVDILVTNRPLWALRRR